MVRPHRVLLRAPGWLNRFCSIGSRTTLGRTDLQVIWYDNIRGTWYLTCPCGAQRKIHSPTEDQGRRTLTHRKTCPDAIKYGWKLDKRGGKRRPT